MSVFLKHILFICSFLLIGTSVHSQNAEIDSLTNVLQNHKANDTTKVNLLNALSFEFTSIDVVKSEEFVQNANTLAKEINYKKGEARSCLRYSYILMKKPELVEAKEYALKAQKIYEDIDNSDGIISSNYCLAKLAYLNNDIVKAKELYNIVLDGAILHKDSHMQAQTYNNLGVLSYTKGDLDEALFYFKQSSELRKLIGQKEKGLSTLNNIAVICLNQGRHSEALKYFNECLSIYKAKNDKGGIYTATYNMSAVYYELKQYDKTLSLLDEAYDLAKELQYKKNIASCLINKGAVYADLKEFSKALKFMQESLAISEEIEDESELSAVYFQLGDLYALMGEYQKAKDSYQTCLEYSTSIGSMIHTCHAHIGLAQTNNELGFYSKALHHGQKAMKIADELKLLSQQKLSSEVLAKIYRNKNDFKKAFENHQQFKLYNDSLFNQENTEKIIQLEYEYKYKQELDSAKFRELELIKEVEETEKYLAKSQRNSLLGVIAFLILTLILGFVIFFFRLRSINAEAKNIMVEQKLLRSQMTPHFIFNALSVLQGMILNKEDKKAVSYLAKFSKLLRLILENSRDKTVSLDQELTAVETYLSLQNIEETNPYIYSVLINENIDKTKFGIPPMLIQPFIENAIEHAFGNQKENRKIDIHLNFIDQKLICTIKDNGMGIDSKKENMNDNKKSLATTITSERLKSLSKEFKMKGSINIEDRSKHSEQGTIVTLVIPYKILVVS